MSDSAKNLTSKRILSARKKVRNVAAIYRATVHQEILRCKHEHIAECPYEPCDYGRSTPEWRICLNCGLAEEGWGVGFVVLKGNPQKIKRSRLLDLRTASLFESDKYAFRDDPSVWLEEHFGRRV